MYQDVDGNYKVQTFNDSFLFASVQESPGEGINWSIMSLHGIDNKDSGNYSCIAKNVAGTAKATISLTVASTMSATAPALQPSAGTGPTSRGTAVTPPTDISKPLVTTPAVTPRLPTTLSTTQKPSKPISGDGTQRVLRKDTKSQQGGTGKKLAADEKSKKTDGSRAFKDLDIVEQTADSAVLLWTAGGLLNDAPLTVVYSPYGEDDSKRTVETKAGSGKVLLDGLSPGMRYSVCLVAKGSAAGKDPCIDFYTEDGRQNGFFLIMSVIACVLVLPLIALLVYKILALYCKGRNTSTDENEMEKDSYVKFETISMKRRTLNSHPTELWARRPTNESERLLLCSRSSIDSQMTYRSDCSRSEYLC